jgi:hypothetical protein
MLVEKPGSAWPNSAILVRQVVDRIVGLTNAVVEQLQGVEEGVSFPLPKELVLG